MGRLIDENKLIDHFVDKTPNGWLVPICENTSRWSLEGIISEIKYFKPTEEAISKSDYEQLEQRLKSEYLSGLADGMKKGMEDTIPKSDYETRLKADMVAMFEEIKNGINYQFHDDGGYYADKDEVDAYMQQKINELKSESEKT